MQPKLEKISSNLLSSLAVKREISPYMDYPLHYHPEYEIILVEKSRGIRLMGNHVGHFTDGDLVFISSNLPHVWKNDKEYYQGNKDLNVDVFVIHFREDALCDGFFNLAELTHVKKLFALGKQGILIKGKDHEVISNLIRKVYHTSGFERLITFLHTLDAFANAKEYELLSSHAYAESNNNTETERINLVIDFLMQNYATEVSLDQLASLASMNKSSFCRYFKSRTHKTCSQFLNEIRITHACKLLINTDMAISNVCYKTGYNNVSHFNRQFKLITGSSAKAYKKEFLKNV